MCGCLWQELPGGDRQRSAAAREPADLRLLQELKTAPSCPVMLERFETAMVRAATLNTSTIIRPETVLDTEPMSMLGTAWQPIMGSQFHYPILCQWSHVTLMCPRRLGETSQARFTSNSWHTALLTMLAQRCGPPIPNPGLEIA